MLAVFNIKRKMALLNRGRGQHTRYKEACSTLSACFAGGIIDMGDLTYYSPRNGPTVWEIGVPDRTAAGFFVPDPNPKYVNKLYLNSSQK